MCVLIKMETKEIINKCKFEFLNEVIEQKDIRLSEYKSILEAIKDKNFKFEADSTVLVLAKKGKMFEINLIGAIVWEGLKKKFRFEKIVKIISDFFEADPKLIEKDVNFFFQELLKNGFVKKL